MDSDLQHQQFHHHFQGLQRQMNTVGGGGGGGGLTRFRSAPTSYFSALMDTSSSPGGDGAGNAPPPRPLSPETESFLARFVQSVTDAGEGGLAAVDSPDLAVTVKQETEQNLPSLNQMSGFHSTGKPPLARRSSGFSSLLPPQMKMETGLGCGRSGSGLSRFKSSPAGLFDDLVVENGFLVNRTTPVAENYGYDNKSMVNTDVVGVGDGSFISSFPAVPPSWEDDSSVFSEQFPKVESGVGESENQEKGGEKRPWGMLAHHLSLPKASMEKLMKLEQESVPCQMRAKRGCATHPRSIAERVRRTKISERMRKLQDLVPNMDKQTNTSDMLDFAADYIKDLQRQVQTLSNKRARCTCSA